MKILMMVGSLTFGGAEVFAIKLFRASIGTSVHIDFLANKVGIFDQEVKEKGSQIYYVPSKSESLRECYRGIKNVLKKNTYDAVIKFANNPFSVIDLMAVRSSSNATIACRSMNTNTPDKLIKKITWPFLRPLLRHYTDVMLAPSKEAGEFLFGKKNFDKKGHVLPNGIPFHFYEYDKNARVQLRNELSATEDTFVIGVVGRLTGQKNPFFNIETFELLQKEKPNSLLVFCGDGELLGELKNLVLKKNLTNKVVFLGSRKDINKLYSAFDCLWLPSFYEGLPNTIIEAQASGLPCLISSSITRECNIIDTVIFLSLNANDWVRNTINIGCKVRTIDACYLNQCYTNSNFSIDATLEILKSLLKRN